VAFYVAVYLFMNLGAFAVVALVRNATGSEEIDAYAGLIYRSTGVAVCFSIILFSLVGLPPLAGFAAKFVAFASVYDAGMLALLAVGLLNTVLSLFYYLRVVKVMVFDTAEDASGAITQATSAGLYLLIVTAPLVVWGVWWNGLYAWAEAASAALF
jgi:NADH-quinone oxidoreductase subunit N